MGEREGAAEPRPRRRAACRLRRRLAPATATGGKGRDEEEEAEEEAEEEEEEEGGRGTPLAPDAGTVAPIGVRRTREEAKREGTEELFLFFTKEKRKMRYIFAGLDSNAKLKKRIRSWRRAREAGESTPGGIRSDQSRPLDGEIERRRTFQATWCFCLRTPRSL
jgi:hypothetical protein